jgi:hypothetical protein
MKSGRTWKHCTSLSLLLVVLGDDESKAGCNFGDGGAKHQLDPFFALGD